MKMLLRFAWLGLFFFLLSPSFAFAQDGAWAIPLDLAEITVQKDGTMDVVEDIQADFFAPKHGIFRDIPATVKLGGWLRSSIQIEVKDVVDAEGNAYAFVVEPLSNGKRIRIGDAGTLISGAHEYKIHYQVKNVVRFLSDHDELYWNTTGTEWEVPIERSGARIHLPFLQGEKLQLACFTGPTGSTEKNCTFEQQGNDAVFNAQDFLTVVVGWPKGLVAAPSQASTVWAVLSENIGFLLPVLAFIIMYLLWRRYGRDPKGKGIVRQYEAPDGLSPLEMAYLVKNGFNQSAISAEIVHLAVGGHLKIIETANATWLGKKSEYSLERLQGRTVLKAHQEKLLAALFEKGSPVALKDLQTTFYSSVPSISKQVYEQLHGKEYYKMRPDSFKGIVFVAIFFVWWGIGFFGFASAFSRPDFLIGLIISSVIVLIFGWLMPQRTEKGVEAYQYAKGFEQYLSAAETERVKFQEKENLFFDYLPYAMVFGLGAKWAAAFAGIVQQPPQWYQGTWANGFSPVYFSQSLGSFSTASSAAFTPPSSSSSGFSGGSSGGGSGGGGGGSW